MSTSPAGSNSDPGLPRSLPADPNEIVTSDFLEYIGQFWTEPITCPVCKTTAWTVMSAIDPVVRYQPPGADGIQVFTLIPVACNTCKYTMFFSAVAAGLFEEGMPRSMVRNIQPTGEGS
jgi:hypothetical protein